MGVMNCSRKDCQNIMCDKYSPQYGYICNSCYRELSQRKFITIQKFMDTSPMPVVDTSQGVWESVIENTFRDVKY